MLHLVDASIRAAQELSWQLTALDNVDLLRQSIEEKLVDTFNADFCSFNDFNPRRRARPVFLDLFPRHPAESSIADRVSQELSMDPVLDHPVINHYFTPGSPPDPVRMSDLITLRELHRTAAYSRVLRPINGNHQLVLLTRRDGQNDASAFALTRESRDFSDEALMIALATQPVLVAVQAALRVRDGVTVPNIDGSDGVLTRRETEVLQLLAGGLTAQAIGHALRISAGTVRKHLENAYFKLGAHDRMGAVAAARRMGVLDWSQPKRSSAVASPRVKAC